MSLNCIIITLLILLFARVNRSQLTTDSEESAETSFERFTPPTFSNNVPKNRQIPAKLTECHHHDIPAGIDSSHLVWMESADNLIPILKDRTKYNHFQPPGLTLGKSTVVRVAMYIESISSFKAQTMDFVVDMYLAMSWEDQRLAHNCTHPILIREGSLAERLWHPDIYFVNSKFAYLQEITTPNFMLLIYPDGFVFKSMRLDVTLSCMMELKDYPMDVQACPIYMQSYAYVENVLNLTWHVDTANGFPINKNSQIKLSDMRINEPTWDHCGNNYPMFRGSGNWSCIVAWITMERLILFHFIQTYIPTAMLVIISWLSFWMDARAAPARISLTITALLTLTTMSNTARQDLPQVSYIKAIDVWLVTSTGFVFAVLLEYTLVSTLMERKTFHCDHNRIVRKLTEKLNEPLLEGAGRGGNAREPDDLNRRACNICRSRSEKLGKRVDKFSRIVFPVLYFTFALTYWVLYLV